MHFHFQTWHFHFNEVAELAAWRRRWKCCRDDWVLLWLSQTMQLYPENENAFLCPHFGFNYATDLLPYLTYKRTLWSWQLLYPLDCEYFPSGCLSAATLLKTSAQMWNRHRGIEESDTWRYLKFSDVFTNFFDSTTWEYWRHDLVNPLPAFII